MIAATNWPVLDSERRKKKDSKHTSPGRRLPLSVRVRDSDLGRYDLYGLGNTWLIKPAFVLPEQFYEGREWREEQLLMREVLLSALKEYNDGRNFPESRHAVRLAREALQWITSPEVDWPFSFLNICEALDIDADACRKWVFAGWVVFPQGSRRGSRRISHT